MKHRNKVTLACSVFALVLSLPSVADEVVSDDLIVDGSQCVGLGCVENQDFGFDTIQLSSDNPQILFEDTSSSAAFPTQDWRMGVADSPANVSTFFIRDESANTTVLQLAATPAGGVALGAGSELVDNAISVGAAGAERRITHVADGVAPTDAVNLGQLEAALVAINARLDDLLDRVAALATP